MAASAEFNFVSSIMSTYKHPSPDPIPEQPPGALQSEAFATGYGLSKWTAEKWLTEAASFGISVRIFRPGVIAGHSTHGTWALGDFIPRLVRSSLEISKFPSSFVDINWLPVDLVARLIVAASLSPLTSTPAVEVFNLVHPHTTSWADFIPAVTELASSMQIVPFANWLTAVQERPSSPANALLSMLEGYHAQHPDGRVRLHAMYRLCASNSETKRVFQSIPANDSAMLRSYCTWIRAASFTEQ